MNKKILSSLITTLLIVSILAIPAPYVEAANYDDLIDTVSPTSGPIGATVTVSGTAPHNITEDYPVEIYWSYTEPNATSVEYGYGNIQATPSAQNWELLETVKEPTTGTKGYEVDVTIPYVPPTYENKYIYIVAWQDKDNDTYIDDSEWDSIPFNVTASIYPTTGHKGDEIVVGGWAITPGGLVEVYWENLANKIGEGYAKADRSFSFTVKIPDPPAGYHSILVYDHEAKKTLFIKNYELKPKITLSPTTTLPEKTVNVTGTGFAANQEITLTMYNATVSTPLTTSPETVKTDDEGSFNCTFEVPKTIDSGNVVYGDYTIKAVDEDGNEAEATVTLSPMITLSPTEGPSGKVVDITGEGFTANGNVTIKMGGVTCKTVKAIQANSSGIFTGKFVVPTLDKGTYTVNASDENYWATASFKVTGKTAIEVTPAIGSPGETITVKGYNFTAIKDVVVTIDFGTMLSYVKVNTTENGEFTVTLTAPDVPGTYTITATDSYDLSASTTFNSFITTMTILPESGPTGTKIHIVASGFSANTEFNATIDGKLLVLIGDNKTSNTGEIDKYAYIPTVPAGVYTITVMDKNGIKGEETFNVTATTKVTVDPSSAPTDTSVSIKLQYFTAKENTTLTLKIYNVTAEGEVSEEYDLWDYITAANDFENGKTDASGSFEGTFKLPEGFALGTYYINATDANGLYAQATFEVIKPYVNVYTGADEYMPGDTVMFFAECDFEVSDKVINLYTPSGFKTEITDLDLKTKKGSYYTGTATYLIPSDAELGTWVWNTTIKNVLAEGTFKVVEKPTISTLSEDVSRLKSDLADLSKTVSDLSGFVEGQASDISSLSDSVKNLRDLVSDLSSSLDKVKEDIADLSTAVSEAQSAAKDASEASLAAQSAVGGISTAVYLAVILSLIAAVAAIMSIIFLQRKIAG